MILDLSAEARAYASTAVEAFAARGTDELAATVAADPTRRDDCYEDVLAGIGAWDLDPRGDGDQLEAAAALSHAAGWAVVDHPVAERLSRPVTAPSPRAAGTAGLVVVDPANPRARIGGIGGNWLGVDLDGQGYAVTPRAGRQGGLIDPGLVDVELEPLEEWLGADRALALLLPCWTLLGHLDRALALARSYAGEREQFGRPIAAFQGVQFALTEAEVERAGVEMLARYALWSIQTNRAEALDDALALRLAALEAAEVIFRITHQVHGAIGYCDETLISWVSRVAQPLCRAPWSRSRTTTLLTRRLGHTGLVGLFDGDRVR